MRPRRPSGETSCTTTGCSIQPHYLPLRNLQGKKEERGIDVWLSLEAYELAMTGRIDTVVLIVSDTDYTPLMRKLTGLGLRIMLLSWEFEYVNDDGVKMVTKTSHELLSLATYPVAMHDVINYGVQQNCSSRPTRRAKPASRRSKRARY